MTDPLWITAVIGIGDGSTPVLAIQPRDAANHEVAGVLLRRAGYRTVSHHEWSRGAWTVSPPSAVDVVAGVLVRITTGTASIYAAEKLRVTPMWTSAARERRALVALIPPGSVHADMDDRDELATVLAALARRRQIVAALATVRFDVFTG